MCFVLLDDSIAISTHSSLCFLPYPDPGWKFESSSFPLAGSPCSKLISVPHDNIIKHDSGSLHLLRDIRFVSITKRRKVNWFIFSYRAFRPLPLPFSAEVSLRTAQRVSIDTRSTEVHSNALVGMAVPCFQLFGVLVDREAKAVPVVVVDAIGSWPVAFSKVQKQKTKYWLKSLWNLSKNGPVTTKLRSKTWFRIFEGFFCKTIGKM